MHYNYLPCMAIILGFCNQVISIIFKHKRLVSVSVNAKQCALSGIMLRTSPILDKVERNKNIQMDNVGNTF